MKSSKNSGLSRCVIVLGREKELGEEEISERPGGPPHHRWARPGLGPRPLTICADTVCYSLMCGDFLHLFNLEEMLVDGLLPLLCPTNIHLSSLDCHRTSHLLSILQLTINSPFEQLDLGHVFVPKPILHLSLLKRA
jgi:hypothetical protein